MVFLIIVMSTERVLTGTRWDYQPYSERYQVCGNSAIGRGGNGIIYLLKDCDSKFAVLKVALTNDPDSLNIITREVNSLRIIRKCKYHIKLIIEPGSYMEDEKPWFIMDFIPGVNLFDLLEAVRGNNEAPAHELAPFLKYCIIYSIARQILDLHTHGLIHRDIKPDNIFIDPFLIPHIGDFGELTAHDLTFNIHGTVNFLPPEAVNGNPHDGIQCGPPYDVYLFGGTLLQILTFEWPYSNLLETDNQIAIKDKIAKGEIDDRFEPGGALEAQLLPQDHDLYAIVKDCWKYNPSDRPKMEEIVQRVEECAAKYLDCDDLEGFEDFKQSFEIDDDEYLGTSDNVTEALKQGFYQLQKASMQNSNDQRRPSLLFAAQALGIDPEGYTEKLIDILSESSRLDDSYRPPTTHSTHYHQADSPFR